MLQTGVDISVHRGDLERAGEIYGMFESRENSTDLQEFSGVTAARAAIRRGEGRLQDALDDCRAVVDAPRMTGIAEQAVKQALCDGIEIALALNDVKTAKSLLNRIEQMPVGARPPLLHGHVLRLRARLEQDAAGLKEAAAVYREAELRFWLAVSLLELGELAGDAPAIDEARGIFEELGAVPWITRAVRAGDARPVSLADRA